MVPIKIRLTFSRLNTHVYNALSTKLILKDYSNLLHVKAVKLESYLNHYSANPDTEQMTNKVFKPSKTAQNGLNFITKEEEIALSQEEFIMSDEIFDLFRVIYILIKQNYELIEESKLVNHLLTTLFTKFKIENLSKINL